MKRVFALNNATNCHGMSLLLNASFGDPAGLTTIFVYALVVVGLAAVMIIASYLLGQRHKERVTEEVYESGVPITGSARIRFSSHFYLVAMFFVIFDLEAVFIISWAIAFEGLGWFGFIGASIFILILTVVLIYEWRIGALDFGPDSKAILRKYQKLGQEKLPEEPK